MLTRRWTMWRHFDYLLLLTAVLLLAYGIVMVYSATATPTGLAQPVLSSLAGRQALFGGAGLVLLVIAAATDFKRVNQLAYPLYALNLLLLMAVAAIGLRSHGAQRWINVAFFEFQPSELAKLLVIITLGKFLADHQEKLRQFRWLLASLALVGVPIVLVYLQPDFGTAMVLLAIWGGMVIMAGARWLHLGVLLGCGGVLAPLFWQVMKPYQRSRLLIFLNPESDPSGQGYNMIQSRISIGSGGWLGQGFGLGTQSQLDFLKVQQTDFIFAVLGEELGFVGAMALFLLFIILLFRVIRGISVASDGFGRTVAAGIASMLLFQIFVNVGMTVGLMPVTGIPLPFISYGLSSLLTTMLALGLLQSIIVYSQRGAWDG
ncbi:MAG: rod shape-determining protein RodA [Chloroflexota bacterium]